MTDLSNDARPIGQRIPLSLIDLGERLRPVDEDAVVALAADLANLPLLNPVTVRPDGVRFVIVAGAHRSEAARLLAWPTIPAVVLDITADEALVLEADENLKRKALTPLDTAIFYRARKEAWERLHPEVGHGKASPKSKRDQKDGKVAKLATFPRFTADVAEKTGWGERTVQRWCLIAAQLSPEVIALIRRSPVATRQGDLEKLARAAPEKQLEAARRLASGEATTVAGAFGRVERNVEERLYEAFTSLWTRAPAPVKRRMLAFVGVSPGEIDRVVNPRKLKLLADAAD